MFSPGRRRFVFQMSRSPRQDAHNLANTNSVMRSQFLNIGALDQRVLIDSVNTHFASFFEFDGVQNNNITKIILPEGNFGRIQHMLKLLKNCLDHKQSVIKYIFVKGTNNYLYNSKDTRFEQPPVLNLLEVLQAAQGQPLIFVMEPKPLVAENATAPENMAVWRLVAGQYKEVTKKPENGHQLPRLTE